MMMFCSLLRLKDVWENQSLFVLVQLAMKGLIETPGLPKADCRRGLARLYLLRFFFHECGRHVGGVPRSS